MACTPSKWPHLHLSHLSQDSKSTETSHEWSEEENGAFATQTFSDDDNYGDWIGHDSDEGESDPDTVDEAMKPFGVRENPSNAEHHADDLDDVYASIDMAPPLAVDPDIRFTLRLHSRFAHEANEWA